MGFRLALLAGCIFLTLSAATPTAAQQAEADVFVAQATLAFEERRYDEALAHLREALAVEPGHVDALYYTGLVYVAQRRFAAAAEVLEQARAKTPNDIAILLQLGIAYFADERYDRAEPLLTRVFEERPRTEGVGYYVGFMRYRRKDYQGALRAFATGASADPDIRQLTRFYSGLALVAIGLPERAAAEVEEALKLQPGSPLTGPAERLRDTITRAREGEQRFRAEVRVGLLYDTNVSVEPNPSHDPTAEGLRRRKNRSLGELAALRLDYTWLRAGPWEATAGYSFFQTHYDKLASFDIQSHLGTVGGTYRGTIAAMPFQTGMQYAYDYLTLDNDEYLQRNSVSLFGTIVENGTHLSSAQLRMQLKDYSADSNIDRNEVRDAKNWMGGLTHIVRFAEDKHLARVGYQLDVEDAGGRNFKYLGHRLLAGGQYTLPWGETRLKYEFDVHVRNYRHAHTVLPERNPGTRERADTEQTHAVRVEKPLPYNLTLSGDIQASTSRSNLPAFSFNREVLSLTLSWQY